MLNENTVKFCDLGEKDVKTEIIENIEGGNYANNGITDFSNGIGVE